MPNKKINHLSETENRVNKPQNSLNLKNFEHNIGLREVELQVNINRLVKKSKENVTISLILGYVKLFLKKRTQDILFASVVLIGSHLASSLIKLFFIETLPILSFLSSSIMFIMTSLVGIKITRSAILTKTEQLDIPFLKGFTSFFLLNASISILTTASIFILTSMLNMSYNNNVEPTFVILVISGLISCCITSLLLARFGFLAVSKISNNQLVFKNFIVHLRPFLKPLFIILFSLKCLSLVGMIVADSILFVNVGIVFKSLFFTLYNVIVYSIIGVSFKLFNKLS